MKIDFINCVDIIKLDFRFYIYNFCEVLVIVAKRSILLHEIVSNLLFIFAVQILIKTVETCVKTTLRLSLNGNRK